MSRTKGQQPETRPGDSEEHYRAFLENINDVAYTIDLQGRFTYISPVVEQVAGYKPEDLLGQAFTSFAHPDDAARLPHSLERFLAENEQHYEFRAFRKDGSLGHVRVSARLVREGDRPVAVSGLITDITDRKQTEEALKESKERYRSLVENISDVVFTMNLSGCFTYISPVVEQVAGYKPEELVGRPFCEFALPDDMSGLPKSPQHFLASSKGPYEFRVFRKDGTIRSVRVSVRSLEKDGRLVGVSGIITDITEQKQAEKALRESEARLRAILEGSPDPIALYNLSGEATYVNPAFTRVFGLTLEEAAARTFPFVPEESRPGERAALERLLRGEVVEPVETKRRTKEGKVLDVSVNASLLRDPQGQKVGTMVIFRDLRAAKQAEKERLARERLLGVLEMAGAAAHELSQPLTAISGVAQLLLMDLKPGDRHYHELTRLNDLTQRLGEISKRIGRIVTYETKEYSAGIKIVDIERASRKDWK